MNTTEKKSRAPKKAKWDKPVTKAFYEKLRLKAVYVVREVHEVPGYVDIIMDFIDRYMFYQQKPFYYTESMWIWSFFAAIQGDIDKAIERRKRAKERAAERKAARERAKAEAESIKATETESAASEAPAETAHTDVITENTGEIPASAAISDETSVNSVAESRACVAEECNPVAAVTYIGEEKKGIMRSKIARMCGSLFGRRISG